jgi:hypothetical protein
VAIYTGAKALSRWPINDESTLTASKKFLSVQQERLDIVASVFVNRYQRDHCATWNREGKVVGFGAGRGGDKVEESVIHEYS